MIFLHLIFDGIVYDEILGDTVKYTLRIRRPEQSARFRASGEHAHFTLISAHSPSDEFGFIPLSLTTGVTDFTPWKVDPGTYRVLLVPDSLYQLCRLPRSKPDTVKLTPWSEAIRKY